jgi:hypothetical protein
MFTENKTESDGGEAGGEAGGEGGGDDDGDENDKDKYDLAGYTKSSKKQATTGGGGGIGVYKSADPSKFEAKSVIRQWSCLNLNPLKALL